MDFRSKKRKEREKRAQETIDGLVQKGTRKPAPRRTYQVTCGHCNGHRVMSNGKPCRNCGGSGKITRG